MDSFEVNKILGAFLGACLAVLALNIAAQALYSPEQPAKPGYEIAATEPQSQAGKPSAPAPAVPIEQLLASASVDQGEQAAKKCATCHTFAKGAPAKIGPDLWDVVGRPKASFPGFKYSAAMQAKGGNWTIDDLNQFLTSPKGFVPGTAMSFAGLPKDSERANVLAYLNSLSDNPAPLPKAAENAGSAKP